MFHNSVKLVRKLDLLSYIIIITQNLEKVNFFFNKGQKCGLKMINKLNIF